MYINSKQKWLILFANDYIPCYIFVLRKYVNIYEIGLFSRSLRSYFSITVDTVTGQLPPK